jgi:membrane protease YdiL (CAAX protease family)
MNKLLKGLINWKIFFILLSASVFSILAIMPYILRIQGDLLTLAPIAPSLAIVIMVLQSTLFFAIFILIGLKLSDKLELKLPIIESFLTKKKQNLNFRLLIKKSILLGILAGIIIILLDYIFFQFGLESLFKQISIPIWQGFLASFYGGIAEEIAMRLFLMTLIIWLISKIKKPKGKIIENSSVVWSSIIIVAILFGIGHLPITTELMKLTPLVIFRALLLNGIGGALFGWLYWKKGLESAMIAHFSTDIVIYVFLPLVIII